MQSSGVVGSGKLVEDKSPKKSIGIYSLEGSSALGSLALERICEFVYYN